jgi:hypothetical protein
MPVGFRPFHRNQRGAAPLAANADALDEAHNRQGYGAPDADRGVARDKPDGKRRKAGQQQCGDQRGLAPDAIAVMTEKRRADRSRDKPDRVDAEGLQSAHERIGRRKKELGENQRRDEYVKQEIIGFDHGADGGGDNRAAQLCSVLGIAEAGRGNPGCRHCASPCSVVLSRRPKPALGTFRG